MGRLSDEGRGIEDGRERYLLSDGNELEERTLRRLVRVRLLDSLRLSVRARSERGGETNLETTKVCQTIEVFIGDEASFTLRLSSINSFESRIPAGKDL